MVRLKQRYILIEVLQPPADKSEQELFFKYADSPSETLRRLHRSCSGDINPKTLSSTIRKALQEYYGDFGASFAMQLNIKYFNNKTATGIIKCGIQHFEYVLGALTMIKEVSGHPVIIQSSHVSGTIKKCEEAASRKDRELMRAINAHRRAELGERTAI